MTTTAKKKAHTSKKTYEAYAILFLLPAIYIQVKWLQVFYSSSGISQTTRTREYLNEFPAFLSSYRLIAFICLVFVVLSIYFASFSFNQPKMVWRISSFVIVLLASLMGLLSLFQLI